MFLTGAGSTSSNDSLKGNSVVVVVVTDDNLCRAWGLGGLEAES